MLLPGIFFVLEDVSLYVPPGGLDVLLALYELELHHGGAGLVQARLGCGELYLNAFQCLESILDKLCTGHDAKRGACAVRQHAPLP